MSGFDPRTIRAPKAAPRPPTLVERVRKTIAPPGTKIDQEQADLLVTLVNRADARALLRGRGPYQRFVVQRTLEQHLQRIRRRVRRRQKGHERRALP